MNRVAVPEQLQDRQMEPPTKYSVTDILNDVRHYISRFCVFPDEHCLVAVTLWAAHTHLIEHLHTTPRLAVLSPEPESGKSRVLEVLDLLTPHSMLSVSPSPATIFRTLNQRQITLLMDEVDTIFKTRGKDDTHEDLRGLLNAGYRRGATIPRCVGPKHEVVDFPVFCAVALAGLGNLPDTIMTRSIIVRMRRRSTNEQVEPFRYRKDAEGGHVLRGQLSAWAASVADDVGKAWPEFPEGVTDRLAECWEPLIAVADAAGGDWPKKARDACKAFKKQSASRPMTLGIRLLSDLSLIFGESIALHTETIIERLCNGEKYGLAADAPWEELYGNAISERYLASALKKYGIKPQKVKVDGRSLQGYRREHFWDAWQRYLPPPTPEKQEPSEPSESSSSLKHIPVPEVPDVPDSGTTEEQIEELI